MGGWQREDKRRHTCYTGYSSQRPKLERRQTHRASRKQFNARTQDQAGKVLPVVITVYSDKSFSFEVKQPPVAVSLKEAAKISKASGEPNRKKVATVTWDQVKEIAQSKMPDLNAFTLRSAMSMVAGTARSMGIKVEGEMPENL